MKAEFLEVLRSSGGTPLRLVTSDGEKLIVRGLSVSEEDEDVTFELISSSQPNKFGVDIKKNRFWLLKLTEIVSVERLDP